MSTYAESKQGYINLWSKAVVRARYQNVSKTWAGKIIANRSRYLAVQQQTGVPWWFVGLLHMRESSLNMMTYLGDGSDLAGRWPTFEAGAAYALQKNRLANIKDWPISFELWAAESYNGFGYETNGVNSPYVWSFTNLYGDPPNIGKYDRDGHFSSTLIDPQPGVAAVLGYLIVLVPEIADYLAAYKEEPVATTPPSPPISVPPPPAPAPDPYAPIIEMLKQQGRWPAPGTISLVVTPGIQVIVNGKVVQQAE